MADRQLVAHLHVIEGRRTRCAGRASVGDANLALGAHRLLIRGIGCGDLEDVHVVHDRVLHGRLDRRIDILGGDADDGGVQGVHPFAGGVGEGVGHGDEVSAGNPAYRGQFDIHVQFVIGHDRAVLLEDFFGLHVGVVADDHRLEQVAIGGHGRYRREGQRRHQTGVAQLFGSGHIPVRRVVVLHGAGIFAHFLAADPVGFVQPVVVADPRFHRRRFCCCGHEFAQLFYRLVRCGRPEHSNAPKPR